MIRLIKKERINVIRATDPYWCGFCAWAVSKITQIPFCISIHADYEKNYQLLGIKKITPIYRAIERFVLQRAKLVMSIRDFLIPKLLEKGTNPSRIRVIPHGFVIENFEKKEVEDIFKLFGISHDKKVICFIGRLSRENYIDDLVELANCLSKNRNDFAFLLVGDGPEKRRLEEIIKDYGLNSQVIFTGFQSIERVISIRRQSYLAICLMGGFSLIEACAAGCPIVSYNVNWHYELVKNGETGFLVQEGDLNALTETVLYLLDHPGEAKAMGKRAQQLAFLRHDLSKTSKIKKECYRELLQ